MIYSNDIPLKRSDKFKVHIVHRPWEDTVEVWLVAIGDKHGNGKIVDGKIFFEEKEEGAELGSDHKPLFVMPHDAWNLFKSAIFGVENPPEKQAVDAELAATKRHLQDMRRLVFEEKDEINIEEKLHEIK